MDEVSVVIPTYNDADSLPQAIESVRDQTARVSEIIVVDDASDDDPKSVIECYQDERIEFLSHDKNRGGSAARNTGIEFASGEYIAFIDADDEWLPKKIERQMETIKARSHEWVAVHCEREFQFDWKSRLGYLLSELIGIREEPPKEGGEELIKEVLLLNLSTGASTLLVKREIVEKIGGFDPEFPRHQDWEFLIRVLKQGKIAHVDEELVIKHGTGRPSAEVHAKAKKLLLNKFKNDISKLENEGYDITHNQQVHLAKLYIEEGYLQMGMSQLSLSKLGAAELLSLCWSIALGIRRRLF